MAGLARLTQARQRCRTTAPLPFFFAQILPPEAPTDPPEPPPGVCQLTSFQLISRASVPARCRRTTSRFSAAT
jgi:hypothetical protein